MEQQDEKTLRLPYFFAKTHGIVITDAIDSDTVEVYHLTDTPLSALAEVKRTLQRPLHLKQVTAPEFQQHLAKIYQASTSILDATEGFM